MKIKNSTIRRISSSIWLITLILFSLIWWLVCVVEWLSKIKHRKLISTMHGDIKITYYDIVIDAYKTIIKDMKRTIQEIKSGKKLWR